MEPTKEKMVRILKSGKIKLWNRYRMNRSSTIDLSAIDLSGANLSWANLFDANLSGANLFDANLFDANLSGVDLFNTYLSNAKNILQFGPMRKSGRLVYAVNHYDKIMILAGCFWGTTIELRTRVKDDAERFDYILLCDYAEKAFSQKTGGSKKKMTTEIKTKLC